VAVDPALSSPLIAHWPTAIWRWDDTGVGSVRSLDHDRELLRPGRTVALELAPDHPVEYDAWDLESWTRRLGRPLTERDAIEVLERGPLIGAVRVTRTVGPSTFAITYRLAAGSDRLDVVVDADWHHDEAPACRWPVLDVTPTGRCATSSLGNVAARPTPAPHGTRPSSRSAPTASSTWPSPRSASPS
jgi:alpha-mannosidase